MHVVLELTLTFQSLLFLLIWKIALMALVCRLLVAMPELEKSQCRIQRGN